MGWAIGWVWGRRCWGGRWRWGGDMGQGTYALASHTCVSRRGLSSLAHTSRRARLYEWAITPATVIHQTRDTQSPAGLTGRVGALWYEA